MKYKLLKSGGILAAALAAIFLAGCGGSKVLRDPQPFAVTQSLAGSSDQRLAATLDWIIVRDGPGSWAKNADWDEYLMRAQNRGDQALIITQVSVTDSLGTRIRPGRDRKQLVRGAKNAVHRYQDDGLKVKAGAGAGTLVAAGAITGATTIATVTVVGPFALGEAGAVAASGGLLLAPVLAVGGIMRSVNNGRVSEQIESRQSYLPVVLQADEQISLDIFFPLTPSPQQIEVRYADATGDHTLVIDTRDVLRGLHLAIPGQDTLQAAAVD